MSIPTFLIKIGGVELEPLKVDGGYRVTKERLYGDASRAVDGSLRTEFIGFFPKISVTIVPSDGDKVSEILAMIRPDTVSVEYWDEEFQDHKTANFYTTAPDINLIYKQIMLYNEFSFELVTRNKEV